MNVDIHFSNVTGCTNTGFDDFTLVYISEEAGRTALFFHHESEVEALEHALVEARLHLQRIASGGFLPKSFEQSLQEPQELFHPNPVTGYEVLDDEILF